MSGNRTFYMHPPCHSVKEFLEQLWRAKHAQLRVWSSRVGKAWSRVTAKFGEISSAACLFHGSPCCALAADSENLLHNYMNGTSVFCRLPAIFPQCLIVSPLKFILGLRSQLKISPTLWDLAGIGIHAWASKSSIQLLQSYCHTKLVSLSEGRHSRTYGLWMLLKWGRLRSSLGSVKTRPPSPLRIPAWIPRHRRNIFLLLVTMTHKSDSGDKLRTIQ